MADKARKLLLEDPALKNLRPQLEFVSRNWRDLTPALTSLSCESVGGKKEETYDVSLAMCLMHLSFYIWDDMLDNARCKSFKPTFFGKFGASNALVVGGLASAKAFLILNDVNLKSETSQTVTKLIWNLWTKMAKGETVTKGSRTLTSKFWKIKMEAADTETCFRLGAIVGNGSKNEIDHLAKCGHYLGVVSSLWNDFWVSINLTLELSEKIRSGRLPCTLLWSCSKSKPLRTKIENLANNEAIEQTCLKEIVQEILATGALEYVTRRITSYSEKAKKELLCLKRNNAVQTLESFVGFQPRLFIDSVSMVQASRT